MAEKEKEKEIQGTTEKNEKTMEKFDYRDLEKQVENHMKFHVPKSQKKKTILHFVYPKQKVWLIPESNTN